MLLHKHMVIAPTAEAEALAEQVRTLDPTDHLALWVTLVSAAERGSDEDVSRILVSMSESMESRRVRQMLINEAAERLPKHFEDERRGLWEQMVQLAPENERGWQALLALYGDAEEPTALREYLHRLQDSISHLEQPKHGVLGIRFTGGKERGSSWILRGSSQGLRDLSRRRHSSVADAASRCV